MRLIIDIDSQGSLLCRLHRIDKFERETRASICPPKISCLLFRNVLIHILRPFPRLQTESVVVTFRNSLLFSLRCVMILSTFLINEFFEHCFRSVGRISIIAEPELFQKNISQL